MNDCDRRLCGASLELTRPVKRTCGLASALLLAAVLVGCGAGDTATLLKSAQQHLDRDNVPAALIQVRNAVKQAPESAAVRLLLARALIADGDLLNAANELDRAERFGASEVESVPVGVSLLLSQGRHLAVAQGYKDKVLPDARANADLRVQVATAFRALDRLDEAEAAVQQALAAVPGDAKATALQGRLALDRGDKTTASRIAGELLDREPTLSEALLLQGDLLADGGADVPGAISSYRKVLETKPRSLDAHGRLITLLLRNRDLAGAQAQVAALAKLLPGRPLVIFNQALVAFSAGDMPRVRELTQLLLRGPLPIAQVQFIAGMAEMNLGALAQAETLLAAAVRSMPAAREFRAELAVLYIRLGRPDAALETLKPVLADASADGTVLRLAGQAYSLKGEFRGADAMFARAAALRADDTRLRTVVASSLIRRGDVLNGIRELEAAAAADATGISADLALVSAQMRRNDTRAALVAIDALERKFPKQVLPDLLRARIFGQTNNAAAARQAYERVLVKDPKHEAAMLELGALDLAEQKLDMVRARYTALLKAHPASAVAMMGLADLSRREGQPMARAFEWVDKAVKANPSDAAVWRAALGFHRELGDAQAMLARSREALAAVPNDPELLLAVADAQLAGGDREQALSTLNRAVELRPDSHEGHLRLARLHASARSLAAARKSLDRALALQPDSAQGLRMALALANEDGNAKQAEGIVRDVQRRLPGEPLGWQLEGEMAVAAKRWDASLSAFRKALSKRESSQGAIQLHQTLILAARRPEAEQFAVGWVRSHPTDVRFILHVGEDALRREDWAAAEERFRQAAKLQPSAAGIYNNLAYALLRQKDPEALDVARQAVKMAPWMSQFMSTLASAYAEAKQPVQAVAWQRKAVELAPQVASYRLQLVRLHLAAGSKKEAREELERLERQGLSALPAEELQTLMRQAQG